MGLLVQSLNRFFRPLLWAVGWLLLLSSNLAMAAPSACGALWGLRSGNLSYLNRTTGVWTDVAFTGVGTTPNAIAGSAKDGNLYFAGSTTFVTAPLKMIRANFNSTTPVANNVNTSGTVTFSDLGAISIPASITYTSFTTVSNPAALASRFGLVGATFDRDTVSPRMYLYVTSSAAGATNVPVSGSPTVAPVAAVGMVGLLADPNSPGNVSWSTLYQTSATGTVTYPLLGNSGDIYIDQGNQAWIITTPNANLTATVPNMVQDRLYRLTLGVSGSNLTQAKVDTTSTLTVNGSNMVNPLGSVAVDPVTGRIYVASSTETYILNTNYSLAPANVDSQLAATGHTGLSDAGNCVEPPDPPSITKSFNPTSATTPSTTTLTITIKNPNKLPIYLSEALVDSLPSGMVVSSAPNFATATSCFSTDGPVTLPTTSAKPRIEATAGGNSVTVTSGIMIPGGSTSPFGGSCTFSVNVTATLAAFYPNTIAAGALKTTSGDSASAATATYQITSNLAPNPPTVSKSFSPITESATVGTTTLTLIVVNPNSITNTLTTALLDDFSSSNLTVVSPAAITATCFSAGTPVAVPAATTMTATLNTLQLATGSLVPGGTLPDGGSCSFRVQLTATVPSFNLNTIPAGSLTMVSGSNANATSATFYLRGSDFGVTKSQRSGETGATTTGVINVPVSQTISYVIQIRNLGGVSGTRGFTDTIPALITPVISVTAAAVGTGSCTTATSVVGNQTILRGTVTGVPFGSGCDVTVVAKSSATSVLSAVTNTVGIYVINSEVETSTVNDSATVVLNIKPSVNLTITKTNGTVTLLPSSTTAYTVTIANTAGATATGALFKDPAVTGLSCTSVACTAQGGAVCPTSPLVSALQGTGITIPSLPAGSSVSFVLTCDVTATGL